MADGVQTGVALSGTGGPCDERPDDCVFFDGQSDPQDDCSHVITVDDPMQVLAYDLPDGDSVVLQQVSGSNDGDFFADVVVNGQTLQLDADNNRLFIPFMGRFRLRYIGTPGVATVVCEPSDCCFAPLFPQQVAAVEKIQVTDAFGVNLFLGDPNDG